MAIFCSYLIHWPISQTISIFPVLDLLCTLILFSDMALLKLVSRFSYHELHIQIMGWKQRDDSVSQLSLRAHL